MANLVKDQRHVLVFTGEPVDAVPRIYGHLALVQPAHSAAEETSAATIGGGVARRSACADHDCITRADLRTGPSLGVAKVVPRYTLTRRERNVAANFEDIEQDGSGNNAGGHGLHATRRQAAGADKILHATPVVAQPVVKTVPDGIEVGHIEAVR